MKTSYCRAKPGKAPKIACFDLETEGLGGRVLAASYIRDEDQEPSYICDGDIIQTLFDIMCDSCDQTWFAHNAQYDWRYFVDRFIELKDDIEIYTRAANQVFMITIRLDDENTLTMRDSLSLFPHSLKKFTEQFAAERSKLSLDFSKVTFDPKNPKHVDYAKRDVESLQIALRRFDGFLFDSFDVHIRSTISSTALAAWERTLDDGIHYDDLNRQYESFIREAYYGGIVYLSSTLEYVGAVTYDINSSYPFQMESHSFPTGRAVPTDFFNAHLYGIYDVTLFCPETIRCPIIPKRTKHGLVWRTGMFRTTTTNVELQFALDKGYRLVTVHQGLVFTDSCEPFKDFVDKCKNVRKSYKGQALETVAKLMQNSLYGKFGTRRDRTKFYGSLPPDQIAGCEPWGEFLRRDEAAEDMLCMPVWAVFTTAYARLHLLRAIYALAPENVIYADTDSVTLSNEDNSLDIGSEYGQWKHEKTWLRFRAQAPKVYAGLKESGDLAGAAKGIPTRVWKEQKVLDTILSSRGTQKVVHYRQLVNFVNTLRDPDVLGESDAHRHLSSLGQSVSWYENPDGSVRPKSWQDDDSGDWT